MLFHFNFQSSHSFATNNMQLSQCSLEMFRNLPREVIDVKHHTPRDQKMLNNEDEICTLLNCFLPVLRLVLLSRWRASVPEERRHTILHSRRHHLRSCPPCRRSLCSSLPSQVSFHHIITSFLVIKQPMWASYVSWVIFFPARNKTRL